MIIKIHQSAAVAGGRAIMLCDDEGEPLPMQTAVRLDQSMGDASQITVTFAIDGKLVRLAD